MSEALASRVFQRWAHAQRPPLMTTLEMKAEIAALDSKLKTLTFQKGHATSIGRRNALVNAINAAIRERNQLAKRYNETAGHV
jgi:hypothetical protein